jgi:CRP/FNR family transcriptional regulator, anaerobic regulatory protein
MLTKVFPQFPSELITELTGISSIKTFEPGEFLVKKGDTLLKTSVVLDGMVKLYHEGTDGEQFVITYLQPGHSFGIALCENGPVESRIALVSLIAMEPVTLLTMSFQDKDRLARKYDEWYSYILQSSVMHCTVYMELVDSIAFRNLDDRIIFFLQRLSQARESTLLQISHQEIADGLNSSREVVSRLLKKLEIEKKISLGHNSIQLLHSSGV